MNESNVPKEDNGNHDDESRDHEVDIDGDDDTRQLVVQNIGDLREAIWMSDGVMLLNGTDGAVRVNLPDDGSGLREAAADTFLQPIGHDIDDLD